MLPCPSDSMSSWLHSKDSYYQGKLYTHIRVIENITKPSVKFYSMAGEMPGQLCVLVCVAVKVTQGLVVNV